MSGAIGADRERRPRVQDELELLVSSRSASPLEVGPGQADCKWTRSRTRDTLPSVPSMRVEPWKWTEALHRGRWRSISHTQQIDPPVEDRSGQPDSRRWHRLKHSPGGHLGVERIGPSIEASK